MSKEININNKVKKEIKRCKELMQMYLDIPTGVFGAIMIKQAIRRAELALESGALISLEGALKELKEIEG